MAAHCSRMTSAESFTTPGAGVSGLPMHHVSTPMSVLVTEVFAGPLGPAQHLSSSINHDQSPLIMHRRQPELSSQTPGSNGFHHWPLCVSPLEQPALHTRRRGQAIIGLVHGRKMDWYRGDDVEEHLLGALSTYFAPAQSIILRATFPSHFVT